jgi:hypothetical protein
MTTERVLELQEIVIQLRYAHVCACACLYVSHELYMSEIRIYVCVCEYVGMCTCQNSIEFNFADNTLCIHTYVRTYINIYSRIRT